VSIRPRPAKSLFCICCTASAHSPEDCPISQSYIRSCRRAHTSLSPLQNPFGTSHRSSSRRDALQSGDSRTEYSDGDFDNNCFGHRKTADSCPHHHISTGRNTRFWSGWLFTRTDRIAAQSFAVWISESFEFFWGHKDTYLSTLRIFLHFESLPGGLL